MDTEGYLARCLVYIDLNMVRAGAVFHSAHVQRTLLEVHLIPSQVHQLGDTQLVAEGHQDHSGIAMAVAVAPGGFDERFHLNER